MHLNGLGVLVNLHVIERAPEERSTYELSGFNPDAGYAKSSV